VREQCARRPPATSGKPFRPETPNFGWPFPVQEVGFPVRPLQPEHLLKTFEGGAPPSRCVCEEGNCHHHEGNKALPSAN